MKPRGAEGRKGLNPAGVTTVDRYLSDVRASLRIFRRSPGLAVSSVAALAMGIGFTTTMFSIVYGATRSLPFARPETLVAVAKTAPRLGTADLDAGSFDYLEWARQQRRFEGLAAFETRSVNIGDAAQRPERRSAAVVTPNTFSLIGVQPLLGRSLLPDDARPGAPPVVVLSRDLWRARYQADAGIVGRVIRVDKRPHTVVGVMPHRFGFPISSDLWLPLAVNASAAPGADRGLQVFGRLKEGVSLDAARAEMATIARRVAERFPETHADLAARVYPFVEMEMEPQIARALVLMLGAVSFVLLIACANVANLLLARAAARMRDVAIRTALGATRARIVGQQLAESALLALAGGVVGLGIATVAVRFFATSTSGIIEAFWMEFRVDGAALAFAATLVTLAALAAGMLPALRASGSDVAEALKDAPGGTTGLRIGRLARSLVVGQVALATGFLIMTLTFTKSAVALRAVELPFRSRQILAGQIGVEQDVLGSAERRSQFAVDLTARLNALPGVAAASLVSRLPGTGAGNPVFSLDAPPAGQDAAGEGGVQVRGGQTTGLAFVTPGFFDVLEARVLRGRGIEWRDGPDAPTVAVVNESWIRRYSSNRDPMGRRLWFDDRAFEIVGVVPDLQMQDPEDVAGDGVYASLLQTHPYAMRVILRTAGDPLALTPALWNAIEAVDPDLPLFEVATLHDAIYAEKKVLDVFGMLFFVFGVGALFLTIIGLYGVVSFAVSRRAREIGIRVALGAAPRDVVGLVLRQGVTLIALGTSIGLLVAYGLSQALAANLEPIEPASPLTYVAIAGTLCGTALLGLLRPVRRALALEPVSALRLE
jgi:predicted permease